MDSVQGITAADQKIGTAQDAEGTLQWLPVIRMTRGPKNKGGCPPDLHLRLSDDMREFISSKKMRYQDVILQVLSKEIEQNKKPDTVLDLQSEIVEIQRQIKDLTKCEKELLIRLQCLIDDDQEFERATIQIHNAVFPEKPI